MILASIRRALAVSGSEEPRRKVVADRLAGHPGGVVPLRGQLASVERRQLFIKMAEFAAASVETIADSADIPSTIVAFLRRYNLPMQLRRGDDARLAGLPWQREGTLTVTTGISDGKQTAAVSHAFAAVAETGTLVLTSGRDNPTTLNFLPDNHIVVLNGDDIAGDFETVWRRLRASYGAGIMPRTINMITGPSRSADIEQTLFLGAHGPRRVHVIVVAP